MCFSNPSRATGAAFGLSATPAGIAVSVTVVTLGSWIFSVDMINLLAFYALLPA
jgi:hypothetical protein